MPWVPHPSYAPGHVHIMHRTPLRCHRPAQLHPLGDPQRTHPPTMRDLLTTSNQNCWKELIDKEAYTRLSWKLKYGHKQQGSQAQGVRRGRAPATLPTLTHLPKIHQAPPKQEEKDEEPKSRELGSSKVLVELDQEMRPATPKTRAVLYDGLSKEGKGRARYLQRRKREGPEHKFQYPILSSWEYGWRIGDEVKEFRPPVNGRSAIVKDTFYKRTGIFYSPSKTDRILHVQG